MKNYKFTHDEIKKLEKHIVIIVDTREKKNEHILNYFNKCNIKYLKDKLNYGDYSFYIEPNEITKEPIYFHDEVSVERKATLEELSQNLAQGRDRFEKELLKAKANGCKMWLSVEDAGGLGAIMEHTYKTDFKPLAYVASLKTYENRFNLHINFVDKKYSGYNIQSTFCYYLRDKLT